MLKTETKSRTKSMKFDLNFNCFTPVLFEKHMTLSMWSRRPTCISMTSLKNTNLFLFTRININKIDIQRNSRPTYTIVGILHNLSVRQLCFSLLEIRVWLVPATVTTIKNDIAWHYDIENLSSSISANVTFFNLFFAFFCFPFSILVNFTAFFTLFSRLFYLHLPCSFHLFR